MRVASIGGGDIRIEGQDATQEQDEVYPENSFAEIAQFCRWRYISLSEYVELNEGPGIWDFLAEVWQTMKQAVADGLAAEGTLPGGLNVERIKFQKKWYTNTAIELLISTHHSSHLFAV